MQRFRFSRERIVASMIEAARTRTPEGVRLATYITCEARIGRPFYAREE
jgi:hypothetical protein